MFDVLCGHVKDRRIGEHRKYWAAKRYVRCQGTACLNKRTFTGQPRRSKDDKEGTARQQTWFINH